MIYFSGKKSNNYFEGWFFKISAGNFNCALIPSISITNGVSQAFIQINCNDISEKLVFDIADFAANDYEVVIGENSFSDKHITFNSENLYINVKFGEFTTLKNDIMGCFKFGTPCKHKIISMKHSVTGTIVYKGKEIDLSDAIGYAEKDWGHSFPKAYCWLQCNEFDYENVSFFFSVAKMGLPFRGLICSLIIDNKEIRFATYNFAKIKKLSHGEIILAKGKHELCIKFQECNSNELLAPKGGKMNRTIKENLNGTLQLYLYENGKLKHSLIGKNAGIEWVEL